MKESSGRDSRNRRLRVVHPDTAGIDVGSEEHRVAVPEGRGPVRGFAAFTADLVQLAAWLKSCGVTTVAMESTGAYWIPQFQVLEAAGLEVCLVNTKHLRNVPGRKSDVLDCQWLRQMHSFGLLAASFRPKDEICVLRSYLRHRDTLVKDSTVQVERMQKALVQMNVLLHNVLSDITGVTGLRILRAILAGERDELTLARMKHPLVRSDEDTIARSLRGDYRPEHLFALRQALELYDTYHAKIDDCDRQIEQQLRKIQSHEHFDPRRSRPPGPGAKGSLTGTSAPASIASPASTPPRSTASRSTPCSSCFSRSVRTSPDSPRQSTSAPGWGSVRTHRSAEAGTRGTAVVAS